jgi:hypothetical protein
MEDSRILSQLGSRSLYRTISDAVYMCDRAWTTIFAVTCYKTPCITCFHSS